MAHLKKQGTGHLMKTASGHLSFGCPVCAPIAYYRCEENGGTALLDDSGNAYDGTISGSVAWVTGKVESYAIDLDPSYTSDYVSLPAALQDLSGELTVACWIKPDSTGTLYGIAGSYSDSSSDSANWALEMGRTSGCLSFLTNSGTVAATSSASLSTGWQHVAVVRSGSSGSWTIKLYIDGVLDTTATTSADPDGGTKPTSIGAFGDLSFYRFSGSIDELYIYACPATDAQILALYEATA